MSQATTTEETTKFWRLLRIKGKITEAKHLEYQKRDSEAKDPVEFYCVARMDSQQITEYTSQVVSSIDCPFWVLTINKAEDFEFESRIGCKEIKLVLWMQQRINGDVPIGKVVIPRNCIKSGEEQWYMLLDASYENKVTGSIEIKIKHFPPKPQRKVHGFSVTIVKCKDLAKNANDVNPFVALHLLPDKDAITTQHTHIQTRTCCPVFQEMFFFTCNANPEAYKKEIHVAVWNQTNQSPGFLGHCTIPLAPVMAKKETCRWYSLSSLDSDSELSVSKKGHKKSYSEDERRNRPREFVKQLYRSEGGPQIQKNHGWEEKTFALQACSFCNSMMMGVHLSCNGCPMVCHQKCKDQIPPTCGGMGAIRLKLDLIKTYVMEMKEYEEMMRLLRDQSYKALITLGRVSNNREEAAKCMIRIENEQYLDFVKSVVLQEIQASDSVATLFRANSMASKALDVYMKHVGSTYLRNTLEDVLKLVILFKKPFELDPTRFSQDKPEKQEGKKRREASEVMDNAETNAVNLTEMNAVVTERIFKSAAHIPWQLKQLFHMIQKAVIEKFPDHENVRYTSVSGFLFLRFFAPAILGPTLFGLKVGIQDPVSSRKLLLIAKTLQNLSNLVEFGQKEPFMEPMNAFIKEKIGEMKKFIDKVSNCTEAELAQKCSPLELPREVLCKDFADLHNILIGAIDKMKQFDPESETLQQLDQQVKSIESKLRFIQEKENDAKYDLLHDTGVEAEESELNEVIKDSEEERKIMRMLTRAGSVDSIASDGTGRSSIGNYRNSVDLKESMAKGQVISQPPPPMTFIAVEPTNDVSEAIQVGIAKDDDAADLVDISMLKKRPSMRGFIKRTNSTSEHQTPSPTNTIVEESKSSDGYVKPQTPTSMRKRMSIINIKTRIRSGTVSRDSVPTAPVLPNTVCPRCSKELKEAFQTVENKRYHNECITCATCKTKIIESAFTQKDDIYCKRCYYVEKGLICDVCDKEIMGDYIVLNDKKYHASCRSCSVCKASIKGKEHSVLGNSIFCAEHKDAISCYTCQKKIEGDVVQSYSRFYHPQHYNCHGCGKDINGCVVYDLRNEIWCQQCFLAQDEPTRNPLEIE